MKNKKIIILLITILLLTGCTKQLKNVDGKIVKNEETGQTLPSNIMCQPTDKDIIKLYQDTKKAQEDKLKKDLKKEKITQKEYDKKMDSLLDIEKLPKCSDFKITSGGYEGLWTTIFIKPLTWFLIKLGELLKNYGLAIIFATLLIRLILRGSWYRGRSPSSRQVLRRLRKIPARRGTATWNSKESWRRP